MYEKLHMAVKVILLLFLKNIGTKMNKRRLKDVAEISNRQFRRRVHNAVTDIMNKIEYATIHTTINEGKITFYCNKQFLLLFINIIYILINDNDQRCNYIFILFYLHIYI